jgi:hypothetical protein
MAGRACAVCAFGSGDCPVRPDPGTRFYAFMEPLVDPVCKTQSPPVPPLMATAVCGRAKPKAPVQSSGGSRDLA